MVLTGSYSVIISISYNISFLKTSEYVIDLEEEKAENQSKENLVLRIDNWLRLRMPNTAVQIATLMIAVLIILIIHVAATMWINGLVLPDKHENLVELDCSIEPFEDLTEWNNGLRWMQNGIVTEHRGQRIVVTGPALDWACRIRGFLKYSSEK